MKPISKETIVDPRTLLDTEARGSPAWALVDALDAAANGMENPEAFAQVASIADPILLPWKMAVEAIRALYAEDASACAAAARAIDDGSPPAALKPLLLAWATGAPSPRSSDPSGALSGLVFSGEHPLAAAADQAEEALRQGLPDRFDALAFRVMRELRDSPHPEGPRLAVRFAAACIRASAQDASVDFFSTSLRALGRADGFAALGFALVGTDDRAAAEAFRGAADAEDGVFVRCALREVALRAARLLDAERTTKTVRSAPERGRGNEGQLDLFAEALS